MVRMVGRLLGRLLGGAAEAEDATPMLSSVAGPPPEPLVRRVLSVTHNPIERSSGRTLAELLGWHDPAVLERDYARDVERASHGLLRYEVTERIVVDGFPRKADGFCYDLETYLRCWRSRRGFHEPDAVDYDALFRELDVIRKVNAGEIDELWLFGFPYAGYYESLMVGPGAFWCNSPPHALAPDLPPLSRRFVVMGFNYEREVGCMLEDLGHRAESIMAEVYNTHLRADAPNLWERFSRYDQVAPGRASVGNMHFAPNSTADYDWGNPRSVPSDCDDWLRFPALTGQRRQVNCRDWGNGDMRLHHLWWFERLPQVGGETDGVRNNWWAYVGDPNNV